MLAAYEDKSAYALCTIAYHSGEDNSDVVLFEGKTMVRQFLWHIVYLLHFGREKLYPHVVQIILDGIQYFSLMALNKRIQYFVIT